MKNSILLSILLSTYWFHKAISTSFTPQLRGFSELDQGERFVQEIGDGVDTPPPNITHSEDDEVVDTIPPTVKCIEPKEKGCESFRDCCEKGNKCYSNTCLKCVPPKGKCITSRSCCKNDKKNGCINQSGKCGKCGKANGKCQKDRDCCKGFLCASNKKGQMLCTAKSIVIDTLPVETEAPTTIDTEAPTRIRNNETCLEKKEKGCKDEFDCCDPKLKCIVKVCQKCARNNKKCRKSKDCCKKKGTKGCSNKGRKCTDCGKQNIQCISTKDCCIEFKCVANSETGTKVCDKVKGKKSKK